MFYIKPFLALVFVACLIGLFALILKKFNLHNTLHNKTSTRKLSIEESLMLDSKRRVVLLRRENKGHLILLGGQNDMVIENDIPLPNTIKEDQDANTHA